MTIKFCALLLALAATLAAGVIVDINSVGTLADPLEFAIGGFPTTLTGQPVPPQFVGTGANWIDQEGEDLYIKLFVLPPGPGLWDIDLLAEPAAGDSLLVGFDLAFVSGPAPGLTHQTLTGVTPGLHFFMFGVQANGQLVGDPLIFHAVAEDPVIPIGTPEPGAFYLLFVPAMIFGFAHRPKRSG